MLPYPPFLIPCLCCLFWVVVLLSGWKRSPRPVKFGAIALVFMGISLFLRVISLTPQYYHSMFHLFEIGCLLSFFSCIILSIKTLTHETPLSRKDLLLFLPGLLTGGVLAFLYLFLDEEKISTQIIQDTIVFKPERKYREGFYIVYFYIYRYAYVIEVILMANMTLLYAWINLNRYKERLESFFSSLDGKSITHGQAVIYFLFAAVPFSFFILKWGYLAYKENYMLIGICLFLWGCALFYLGYHLSLLKYTATDFARELELSDQKALQREKQDNDPAQTNDQEQWSRIRKKLLPIFNRLMDEEHLFLQPNIRLDDLAQEAHSNRNYISILLKEKYQCGFSEYINRRRIEYAKLLVHHDPELTQEYIAEKCGFIHSSSFSRAFRQYTGITFREWVRSSRAGSR